MKRYLRLHKADKHEGIKYSCGDCKFHAAQQQTLRQHKESKHEGIRYIYVLNVTIREELSRILLTTNQLFMKASNTLVTSATI